MESHNKSLCLKQKHPYWCSTQGIFGNDPLANYHHPSNPQQPIHSLRKTHQFHRSIVPLPAAPRDSASISLPGLLNLLPLNASLRLYHIIIKYNIYIYHNTMLYLIDFNSYNTTNLDIIAYHIMILVGGAINILKNMSSSMGRIIPYMKWKIKMFETTNLEIIAYSIIL